MIPKRIRQVLCTLKENTSVSYAHIATMGGFSNLDLLVIKATSPDDFPLNDKYVHDLLKMFSIAPTSCRTFTSCLTRRFMKTQCWRVALKSLLLLHRLLRSLPISSHFHAEMFWARSNGCISLNPCNFQDTSSNTGEDYTVFVRSYAYLLDEAIECFEIDISIEMEEENAPESLSDKMKQIWRLLEVLPQLQNLIDRVMNCRPKGAAAKNFLVQSTMKHIIRDSFICYTTFKKEIFVILDNLIQLPWRDSIEAFDIYRRAANQAFRLSEFYDWTKTMGFCGAYEYPFVDRIPDIQVRALGTFLQGMWQLTESSQSSTSPTSSRIQSPPSTVEDDRDKWSVEVDIKTDVMVEEKKEQMGVLKDQKEMEPLIQLEDDKNEDSWEVLLEASLTPPRIVTSDNGFFFNNYYRYGHQFYENNATNLFANQVNQWQIQVRNPYGNLFYPNPFYQTNNMPIYHGLLPHPTYPWGW